MEKANVINKDGTATNKIINRLLNHALNFYGKEYEDIVIQAIREISFYELTKDEDIDFVIEILTGKIVPKKSHHKANTTGTFLYPKNPNIDSNYGDIIIYRQNDDLETYLTIAHELFGHGVCSRINRVIEKNNKIYNRNGIALHGIDNEDWHNRILNEGFIDYIADSIVTCNGIILRTSDEYMAAKECANHIFDYFGKANVLDAMVLYNYDLEKYMDELVRDGYFNNLSLLNDKRYKYQSNGHYLTSYIYKKKIKKEMKKF